MQVLGSTERALGSALKSFNVLLLQIGSIFKLKSTLPKSLLLASAARHGAVSREGSGVIASSGR